MNTLFIYNTVIYTNSKPNKDLVLKKFKFTENDTHINIFLTKCRNIYFTCSKNHSLSEESNATIILSHLFFLLDSQIKNVTYPSTEYGIVYYFLNGAMEYLRLYSKNTHEIKDIYVKKFYDTYFLPVQVNVNSLECMRSRIESIKSEHSTLKQNVKNLFSDLSDELSKLNNILGKIPEKRDIATQTVMQTQNVWVNKPKINVITQTENKTSEIETQTISEIIQTKSPKKKNKDDIVTMTNNEYMKMMENHNLETSEAYNKGYNSIKNNLIDYFKKNQMDVTLMAKIINVTEVTTVVDAFVLWNLKKSFENFKVSLIEMGVKSSEKIFVPPLTKFWNNIVIKNKDKFNEDIFLKLIHEWNYLEFVVKRGWQNMKDICLDIIFAYYSRNYILENHDRLCFMPPFFYLLFNFCENIIIFNEILRIFIDKKIKYDEEEIINDFKALFLVPSAVEVLHRNKDILQHESEEVLVTYGLTKK